MPQEHAEDSSLTRTKLIGEFVFHDLTADLSLSGLSWNELYTFFAHILFNKYFKCIVL